MKKLLFSLLFMFCICVSKSQSINETISFINTEIMESTKNVYNLLDYDKISVTEKGKIIVDDYVKFVNGFIISESRSAYLKNLKYVETKFFSIENTNHYVIILKSIDGSNCVSRQIKTQDSAPNVDEIYIEIYDHELSEKVKNAIIHLLNVAKENPIFLTKDIF